MNIFDVLFHLFLFLKITSGLKCHECSDLNGGKSCSSLRKFSNKDCDLPISKNERAVCKSSWKEGSLYISECGVASIEEETGCCFKGGPVNNRTICICDKDFCLDKPQPNSIINRCKKDVEVERDSGLKCYECNNVVGHSCASLNKAVKRECSQPNSPGQRSVCKSSWKDGEIYNSECSVAPFREATGCCLKNGNRISCTCNTDLCIENPGPNSLKLDQCGNDDSRNKGLLCYTCYGNDCADLTTVTTSYCPDPNNPYQEYKAVCKTVFSLATNRPFNMHCSSERIEKEAGCCIVDLWQTECNCDTDLCVNDNEPLATALCGTGLMCYDCFLDACYIDTLDSAHPMLCRDNDDQKALCVSIWEKGWWIKSHCDLKKPNEKLGCCVEEVSGVTQTRCTCDEDYCISDGNAVTEICESITGLKCYHCDSALHDCDKLTATETSFCGPPDTASGKKSVCKTTWNEGILKKTSCASVKINEITECCDKSKFSDEYSCTCTSDLCLGDGSGKPTEQCDRRLKCYSCSSYLCNELTIVHKQSCDTSLGLPTRCRTVWNKDGELTSSGCHDVQKHEDVTSNCCYKNQPTKDDKECYCNNHNFCLGDGTGRTLQRCKPVDPKLQNLKLRCYVCNSRLECLMLDRVPVVTCNNEIGSGLTGNDELKHICESKYKNERRISVQCKTVDLKAITNCCAKDFCSCSENKCVGDGHWGIEGQDRPCQCGVCGPRDVECYTCGGVGQPTCKDEYVDATTPRKVCKPGQVCYSQRDLLTDKIKRACYTLDNFERIGICKSEGNIFSCLCNRDLCLGDDKGEDVTITNTSFGIICYQCYGDCIDDLDKSNKHVCRKNEVCYTVAKDGMITGRGCYPYPFQYDKLNFELGSCVRTEETGDLYHPFQFHGDIACFCDKQLCIGDGNGDNGKKPKINYGLKCYICGTRYHENNTDVCPSEPGFDSSKIESRMCEPDEVCASEISADGFRIRYCYQFIEIENSQCTPFEGEIGENVGARCLCNNEDFCIGDGKGNDAQVTKKTAGGSTEIPDPKVLKCYECYNCDYVDKNTPLVSCLVGHCLKLTNDGIVSRSCGKFGTVGSCNDGICACNDQNGCNGSRGLTASASCSVGVAIFISYITLN